MFLNSRPRQDFVIIRRRKRRQQVAPIPLKTLALHTKYFKVMSRVRGYKKWFMMGFLALTVFNLIYAFAEPQPAQALVFHDLTGAGRAAGNKIMESSHQLVVDLYHGKYGLLGWMCRTCLFFATPVAAAGIVQYMSEDVPENPIRRPVIVGSIFLVIALSYGGIVIGHLYLFMYELFEGFFKQMDKYMTLYETIEQGKGYLASNAMISASTAECQKFVGQEQQRCLAETVDHAMKMLNDFKSTYGPWEWVKGRGEILTKIGNEILSSNKSLVEMASQTFFYVMAAPAAEAAQAGLATASITAFTAIYACVMAYIGLAGPIAGLSSLLVPGLQSGWVMWVVSIFSIWFWRVSYMSIVWYLSKVLVNAVPSNIVGTSWFTFSATIAAPIIASGMAGLGAMGVWGGLTGFAGAAASTISLGIVNAGVTNTSAPEPSPAQGNPNALPQSSGAPYVNTNY